MKVQAKMWFIVPVFASMAFGGLMLTHTDLVQAGNGPTIQGVTQVNKPLTQSQIDKISSEIQSITTPNGYFVRTSNPGTFPSDEITHSKAELLSNPNIHEVILPYGTFVKTQPPSANQENTNP